MPEESESSNSVRFVRVVLPWVLAAGMGALYLLTLNHWVSPESLGLIVNVSGLNYRVELLGPVTYLVTWPFRWMPPAWIAPALNLFAAGCAALSLAWLARAVALLPHDRTEAQRQRLQGDPPLLTIRFAWLPPALAVLVCGLQLTFWEHAIVATGEMFDLLLFAWLIRCLLELRTDGNNARLPRFALVYGLAVANNWAMAAFGPLFFLAAIWAARANPFSKRFLERIIREFNDPRLPMSLRFRQALRPCNPRLWAAILSCFLAGLSLFLLLPLLASWPDNAQTDFWPAVLLVLRIYKKLLGTLPRGMILLLCLTSVVPALFVTLRWRSLVGGAGATGKLANGMFHFIHGFLLAVCLCMALDLPLSPRWLEVGFPCLPLYYLGGLSIGYFSGYLLLISGTKPRDARHRSRGLTALVNRILTATVRLTLVVMPALLLYKNLPHILWSRNGALESYAAQLERSLPPAGAVMLSDDPFQLHCLEATLIRRGQQAAYLPIDTSLLAEAPGYFQFLRKHHSEFQLVPPALPLAIDPINRVMLTAWLRKLAAAQEVYYLHPVFGYLGESFWVQPRRLFYQLQPSAGCALQAELLPPDALAENRAFWRAFAAGPLADLVRRTRSPEQSARSGPGQRLRPRAEVRPETDRWAVLVGSYFSGSLNAWGVELQRAGLLGEAADCFTAALQLNPDNAAAQINRNFNQDLQAHKPPVIQSPRQVEAQLGKRRAWQQVLRIDGPIDEPNACYSLGTRFAAERLPRQAIREFARAQTLAPDYITATVQLAEQLVLLADYTNALAQANHALQLKAQNPSGLYLKGYALLQLRDYEHALAPLSDLLAVETNPPASLARGFAYLQLSNLDAARQDFERAAQSLTNAYPVFFNLAEIAYRQRDTAAAIKYGEFYLSNAPPNLPNAQIVKAHLLELRRETNR